MRISVSICWHLMRSCRVLSWRTSWLCSSSSCCHPCRSSLIFIWRVLLMITYVVISFVKINRLIIIWREIVLLYIQIDRSIIFKIARDRLSIQGSAILVSNSRLAAVIITRSTKRYLRWHHTILLVIYHLVILPCIIIWLNSASCLLLIWIGHGFWIALILSIIISVVILIHFIYLQ